MSRFDPPPSPDQQALARIETAISALVDGLQSLALPTPQVSVTTPDIPAPHVDVTVPTEGLVDAVVRAVNEAVAALPTEGATPSVVGATEAVLADGALTPLVEAAQQQRAVLEALQEKLSNMVAGRTSHFDGRLRNESGLIGQDNPLPVLSTTAVGGTELVYFSDATDGTLPSGSLPTIDPVLNTEPNVLDSGWIEVSDFAGKNVVGVLADCSVNVFLMNATDASGDNIFGDGAPTLVTNAGFPAQLSARYADRFYRMVVVNTSGSSCTAYRAFSIASPEDTEGVTTAIDQPVFGFFPANVNRSVIMGRQPDGDYVNVPATGLASDVSGTAVETSTPLAASASYQSGWVDTDGWDEIELVVRADEVSASEGVVIEFTDDAGATTPTAQITRRFTYGADDVAEGGLVVRVPPRLDGFRITYTNGGQPQSDFFLSCTLRADATALARTEIGAQVNETSEAITTKGVVAVRDGTSGSFVNVGGTAVGADEGLNTFVLGANDLPIKSLDSWDTTQVGVTATPVEITSSTPLTGRRTVTLIAAQANNRPIYLGPTVAVNTNNAFLSPGEGIDLELDDSAEVWVVTASGTADLKVIEIGQAP